MTESNGQTSDAPSSLSRHDHSFVVPAYGLSPFLDDCLASLTRQTVRSNILITTSTPSDDLTETARRHGVEIVINPTRIGIAADWNFALRATDARYVTLAHQDDVYAPLFLERSLAALVLHEGAACFTAYQEIDDAGRLTSSKISRVKHLLAFALLGSKRDVPKWRLRAFLSFGNPLPCSSVTFDRTALPDFSFSTDFQSNLDWDAWWRILNGGERFISLPYRLVGRRHNPLTATSRLIANGTRGREDLQMFRRIWPRPWSELIWALYRLGY